MQELKIIGAVLTIASSTAIGFYFSLMLKTRIFEMKELKKIFILLRGDIKFANTPLPEAIEAVSMRSHGTYEGFLKCISKELNLMEGKSFAEIWNSSIDSQLEHSSLTKKDKSNLGKLGETLGYLDKEMQMNTIDLYVNQLEEEIGESIGSLKEKTRVYNALGVMGGIFITIIMI